MAELVQIDKRCQIPSKTNIGSTPVLLVIGNIKKGI